MRSVCRGRTVPLLQLLLLLRTEALLLAVVVQLLLVVVAVLVLLTLLCRVRRSSLCRFRRTEPLNVLEVLVVVVVPVGC